MNKYQRIPETIIDLHGHTVAQADSILQSIIRENNYKHIRIITGIGKFRQQGGVLKHYVFEFFSKRGYRILPAKRNEGGDGAYEVFL